MEKQIDGNRSPIPPIDCAVEADSSKDEQLKDTIDENDRKDEDEKGEEIPNLEPPKDDCCLICFGEFSIPCRANCRHWFCASCILEYWNYSSASRPCKCPMCFVAVTKLTPHEPSQFPEEEDRKTLNNIHRYNRLYEGGIRGFFQKLRESPFLIKKIIFRMISSERPEVYAPEIRIAAILLTFVYKSTSSNFLPTGGIDVCDLFYVTGLGLLIIIRLIGMYRKWRLNRRVMQLAAAPAFDA